MPPVLISGPSSAATGSNVNLGAPRSVRSIPKTLIGTEVSNIGTPLNISTAIVPILRGIKSPYSPRDAAHWLSELSDQTFRVRSLTIGRRCRLHDMQIAPPRALSPRLMPSNQTAPYNVNAPQAVRDFAKSVR